MLIALVALTLAQAAAPYPTDAPLVWPANVERTSPNKKRPWKDVTADAVVPLKLQPGGKVTVVPLAAKLPPQERVVKSVEAGEVTPGFPATYHVIVDAGAKTYLEARPAPDHTEARPFDALLVSPPHSKVKILKTVKDLPAGTGISAATLSAALDLDADGKADAAVFTYCCDKPATAPNHHGSEPCSPECQAIYVRGKDGAWKAVHQASDD